MHMPFFIAPFIFLSQTKNNDVSVKNLKKHGLIQLNLFQTAFAYPSSQGVVAVGPSLFRAVFFEDFGFNQLVMQIVEIVLHFAVGQFAVDQVAEVVVE